MIDSTDDPFAPTNPLAQAAHAAPPGGGSESETYYDIIPPPIGILSGHIAAVKKNPNKQSQLIIEIRLDDQSYDRDNIPAIFIDQSKPAQVNRLFKIAKNLGLSVVKKVNPNTGKLAQVIAGGAEALKGKLAQFVFSTYIDKNNGGEETPQVALGFPDSDKSAAWKDWLAANPLTDEQVAAIKSANAGVMAPGTIKFVVPEKEI